MIVTLTPNPSVDRTVNLAGRLERGSVLRVESGLSQSGGKGVNISRAAVAAGIPSIAVLPADRDDPYVIELLGVGVDCRPEEPTGPIRVNLTITEPDGTTTKLNSPGAVATPESLDRLRDALLRRADSADWVVLAGSLPPGAPTTWYAELVAALAPGSAKVAVDTSEAPLAAVVAGLDRAAPQLMKPNAEELASLTGRTAESLEKDPAAAARAALVLVERGVRSVLVTLGAEGAVLVRADGVWQATPPPTELVSTVGAGDASLFGYLLGDVADKPPAERLALAVAYGSAAASLPGTGIPDPSHVHPELVHVRTLDLPPTPGAHP